MNRPIKPSWIIRAARLGAVQAALITLVIGGSLTVFAMRQAEMHNGIEINNSMAIISRRCANVVVNSVTRYQYGVRGARGAVLSAGEDRLTRALFQRYSQSRDIDIEFPGARGFGIIRRVPESDTPGFLAAARADGAPTFALHQFQPHSGDRAIIQYIEPAERNPLAFGVDLASDKDRWAALQISADTGRVTLTAPLSLMSNAPGTPKQAFLMALPIYHDGTTPATVAERRAALFGWAYAPIQMKDAFTDLSTSLNLDPNAIAVSLSDITDPDRPLTFYQTTGSGDPLPVIKTATLERTLFGRIWQIHLEANQRFFASLDLYDPEDIALSGAFLSLAATMLVATWSLSQRRQRLLAASQASVAAIVESAIDGIIGKTLEGVVTTWNRGAYEIFGYTAQEAVGHSLLELIVPEELAEEELSILARISMGERIEPFETRRHHQDGTVIDVSVSISPIYDMHGNVIGASKTVRDITHQKAVEAEVLSLNTHLEELVVTRTAELESAQRTLRAVLDSIPTMIGYWDKTLVNRVSNPAYEARFNMRPGEMLGRSLEDVADPDLLRAGRHRIDAALRGETQLFELTVPGDDGRLRHLQFNYLPDVVNGSVEGYYVVGHDITDLLETSTRLASALRENEVLLGTIDEQLLFSMADKAGTILQVNDRFCAVHGYAREELVGQNHRLVKSSVHPPEFWETLWATVSGGSAWRGEICNAARDGSLHWFDTVIAPIISGDGEVERYVALRIDVTQRKATDAEVYRLNVLLGNVLRSASEVSIIATDINGVITVFNIGAERMLGYTASEMIGINTPALLHDTDEVIARGQELTIQYGMPIEGFRVFVHVPEVEDAEVREWTYVRKDGSRLSVSLAVTAMRDQTGGIVGYLGIATDITLRKETEATLLLAKQAAEQASRAKSQFLANMSHEIRTPMNAVLGMLQLVLQTPLDHRQRDYVGKAQIAAKSLLGLLNDILDFSKIDAGKLQLDRHPFDLEGLMRDLAVVLSGNQGNSEVEILYEIDPSLPSGLVGDRLRLQQILINLAGNAVKFTQRGQVVVSLEALDRLSDRVSLRFSVRDTGIGISPEQLERIFDGFSQAEASTTRRFGGTGLGLVISRRLVALMGGALSVESTVGQGSRFWFDITLECLDATGLVSTSPTFDRKPYLLVVDDNSVAGEILSRTIESLGWTADCVTSGPEAIARTRVAMLNDTPYDVVLMDWRMPDMDGVRTAAEIRDQLPQDKSPVVIMVTAFGREILSRIVMGTGAPFVDFLTKPVTPQQLVDSIYRAISGTKAELDGLEAPLLQRQRLKSIRLLLVEDNAMNRQVASELLAAEGALVTVAEGGLEGVRKATDAKMAFEIVIMDVQMPDIDGLEATRRIRATEGFESLPILAMTANASPADREACIEAGMNDHVGKPIDMDTVVPKILALMGRPSSVEIPENLVEAALGNAMPGAAEAAPLEPEFPLVDSMETILRRFGQRLGPYHTALSSFRPECLRLMTALEQAITGNNATAAATALHALKGVAATVGAAAVSREAAVLEKEARYGSEGLDTLLSVAVIERLTTLIDTSATILLDRLPPAAPAAPEIARAALPTAEWRAQLQEILGLVETGNLKAIDLIENLMTAAGADQKIEMRALTDHIHQLQFADAAASIRDLLARIV